MAMHLSKQASSSSTTGAVGTYFCDKVYRDDYLPESEEFLLALISLPFTVFLATILGPGSVTSLVGKI